MYTDGLVERRDSSMTDSVAHLLATARGAAASSLEHRLDRLLMRQPLRHRRRHLRHRHPCDLTHRPAGAAGAEAVSDITA